MLAAQAHCLDAIFNNLAQRAIKAEYMGSLGSYLKLALRAQSQARATWETLAAIKNPPITGYVRQANIAHGPQQVNNSPTAATDAQCGQGKHNPQDRLLEVKDGERLGIGTKVATKGCNKERRSRIGARGRNPPDQEHQKVRREFREMPIKAGSDNCCAC